LKTPTEGAEPYQSAISIGEDTLGASSREVDSTTVSFTERAQRIHRLDGLEFGEPLLPSPSKGSLSSRLCFLRRTRGPLLLRQHQLHNLLIGPIVKSSRRLLQNKKHTSHNQVYLKGRISSMEPPLPASQLVRRLSAYDVQVQTRSPPRQVEWEALAPPSLRKSRPYVATFRSLWIAVWSLA